MELKQLYSETVNSINDHIIEYKKLIEEGDTLGLEKLKQICVADKAILRQIEIDSSRLYLDAKDTFEFNKAEFYKKFRDEGQSSLDATNNAKFESVVYSRCAHDSKCQRDKARGLLDDLTNIIIEINIILKDIRQQITYNH